MNGALDSIQKREKIVICPTYARYPLFVERGQGARLFGPEGQEYVDFLSGIAVCSLGHCHPDLTRTIQEQAARLVHTSNLFYEQNQLNLAERLLQTCSMDRVFFCNSGAEANEAAIKIARRYMHTVKKQDRHELITLQGSFHGRTLATLTATGQPKVKEGFDPLPSGFQIVPYGRIEDMLEAMNDRTAAILVEIIQGEGGVRLLDREYLLSLQDECRKRGILFMVDEIQTGMARTGAMWAHQHYGLTPDVMTVAKALANGLPMGAMLTTEEISQAFGPGAHATTFGGGALVSAAAEKVLEIIERDGLVQQAGDRGRLALKELQAIQARFPNLVAEVRGLGLMIGVELTSPAAPVWTRLLDKGFVCNVTQERVLRLLPPLIISGEQIRAFCAALAEALEEQFS